MSDLRIRCSYERRGAAIVGRCPELDDVDPVSGIDRDRVEELLHRAVLRRLQTRAKYVCFVDEPTTEAKCDAP